MLKEVLKRQLFEMIREIEFFTEKELEMKIGHDLSRTRRTASVSVYPAMYRIKSNKFRQMRLYGKVVYF